MKQTMAQRWQSAAPGWIERMRLGKDISREGFLDHWMMEAVGEVRGLRVIDLGCGEGRFCRMLSARGARMVGVDLCQELINSAQAQRVGEEIYQVGDMEKLTEIADSRFDLAVSYLTLLDVLDHESAIRQAFRVLRPGGRFVICNLAPMVTAGNMWLKYGDGTKVCFRLDNYVQEGPRELPLCGVQLLNMHRMLSTYINAFVRAGFVLEALREPVPSAEQVKRFPENEDGLRVPLFVIYLLRKP